MTKKKAEKPNYIKIFAKVDWVGAIKYPEVENAYFEDVFGGVDMTTPQREALHSATTPSDVLAWFETRHLEEVLDLFTVDEWSEFETPDKDEWKKASKVLGK